MENMDNKVHHSWIAWHLVVNWQKCSKQSTSFAKTMTHGVERWGTGWQVMLSASALACQRSIQTVLMQSSSVFSTIHILVHLLRHLLSMAKVYSSDGYPAKQQAKLATINCTIITRTCFSCVHCINIFCIQSVKTYAYLIFFNVLYVLYVIYVFRNV